MAAITLAEYAKTITDPKRRGIIETTFEDEPVYGLVPFRSIPGLALPYNQEESLPAISFRNLNEPFTQVHGIVNRKIEVVKPMGSESDTDIVLVDAYGQTERSNKDRMHAKAMSVKYVQTMFYGNSPASRAGTVFNDVKGFDGIQARVTAGQTLDATGAGTDGSSVFAIRFGDGFVQGLQTPSGVSVKDLGEIEASPTLRTRIQHVAGLGIFHGRSVGWIKNLRAASETLTITLMDELLDLIVGRPSMFVMTKRSRRQLKTSAHGLGVSLGIAMSDLGFPVETWAGIPIFVSDAMIDTEVNG